MFHLADALSLPLDGMARALGIPETKLLIIEGRSELLPVQVSDQLTRIAYIGTLASIVLNDEAQAGKWLSTAQPGLNGLIPLDLTKTYVGTLEVENLLRHLGASD